MDDHIGDSSSLLHPEPGHSLRPRELRPRQRKKKVPKRRGKEGKKGKTATTKSEEEETPIFPPPFRNFVTDSLLVPN